MITIRLPSGVTSMSETPTAAFAVQLAGGGLLEPHVGLPATQLWFVATVDCTNGSTAPVVASTDARPLLAWPPRLVKVPPTKSRLPTRSSVCTMPFIGRAANEAPRLRVVGSRSARPLARTPPTLANEPPA